MDAMECFDDGAIISEIIENNEEIETVSPNKSITSKENSAEKPKLLQLPLARVKAIMKMDPDCCIISQDAVFLTTKATELFLEFLGKEAFKYTKMGKRKTVLKKDLDAAIEVTPHLCFLDGTLEQL